MGLRRPGQLTDTGETLQQRLSRLEIPVAAAASPLGATRAGATPDQAKMAKTQARIQAATQQALAPQVVQPPVPPADQLQTAQRQAQGQGAITVQSQQPQLNTTQALAGLSSLGQQRVQAAINQRLNELSQQQLNAQIVNQAQLAQMLGLTGTQPAEQQAALTAFQQLLQSYAAEPTQEKLVQLEQLRRDAGFQGDFTNATALNQFYQPPEAAVGTGAAQLLQDQLTIQDFTPNELGFQSFSELAQVLGVAEQDLQDMTIQDLQTQVQQAAQREQQHIADLRAKIAASPPGSAQRLIYERRLNNVLAGGASQVELKAAEAAEDIELADKITVGNEQLTVEQLLGDQKFSNLIERYLSAPTDEAKERLLPSKDFGPLREWLDANELGLQDIVRELDTTQQSWQQTLRDWKQIGNLKSLGAAKG